MPRELADRVRGAVQSDIRRYSAICAALGGVNLSQGVCDQPVDEAIKAATRRAIDTDQACYTNLRGIIELRRAISTKLRDFNHIAADPESEIVVTVGSAGAFACAVLALLNPGDGCVVFSPYYSYHVNLLRLFGIDVQFVDLSPPDWNFDEQALAKVITSRTAMIVVNTPANPTGKVFTRSELATILDIARRHDLWVVTDEIYEYFTYDGAEHVSPAALPGGDGHVITISGASKTYAVTGWRIGYAAGPADVVEKMAVVNDLLYICAPAPLQHGITAGLSLPPAYYRHLRDDHLVKRDLVAQTLCDIGFVPFVPAGSYYMLAAFEPGRYAGAKAAAEEILHGVGVATVPGPAFYRDPACGEQQLRFCYAKKMPELEEACRRLRSLGTAATARRGQSTGAWA